MKRKRIQTKKLGTVGERVELFPKGILVHPGSQRPILLLKSKDESQTLPVWLNPIDAGLGLTSMSDADSASPHFVSLRVLKELGCQNVVCEFVRVKGHHQFVRIGVDVGSEKTVNVECRADSSMSFCLVAQARFFARPEVIQLSRQLNDEIDELGFQLRSLQDSQRSVDLLMDAKKTGYLM